MKNIFLLPTDKPSRLYTINGFDKLDWSKGYLQYVDGSINQHIYITSDEEIKEGDWFYDLDTKYVKIKQSWENSHLGFNGKKIILTTDTDLIKDGVQAIDNEFLEWFVKNPSCEEVEVIKYEDNNSPILIKDKTFHYKITIPKEKPKHDINTCKYFDQEIGCDLDDCLCEKQEILSEAKQKEKQEILEEAQKQQFKYDNLHVAKEISSRIKVVETPEEAVERIIPLITRNTPFGNKFTWIPKKERSRFIQGAKWQQERSYSEEDILELVEDYERDKFHSSTLLSFISWFQQNKKK